MNVKYIKICQKSGCSDYNDDANSIRMDEVKNGKPHKPRSQTMTTYYNTMPRSKGIMHFGVSTM